MAEQNLPGAYENPNRFNAKELDRETNLYYYGARYYNPKFSIWYGVDPLAVYNPVMESEFYGDGQHNGGVGFWGNLNPYIYTYQNPIKYIDPNGKQTVGKQIGIAIRNPFKINLMHNVGNAYSKITNNFVYRGATRESETMILTRNGPSSYKSEKDRGSQLGAKRHTLWMAISASRYTSEEAEWAADIHEGGETTITSMKSIPTIQGADRMTDELNNIIGRKYGTQNKNESYQNIAKGVLKIFLEEGLYTLTGNEADGFNIVKTKISEKQYNKMIKRFDSLGKYGDDVSTPSTKQKKEIDKFIKNGTP